MFFSAKMFRHEAAAVATAADLFPKKTRSIPLGAELALLGRFRARRAFTRVGGPCHPGDKAEAGDDEQYPHAFAQLEHEGEAPPAAAPSPANGGGDGGGGDEPGPPDPKILKLRAAARGIYPGCAHWNVKEKASWPPGALIPDTNAMRWEVMQRDASARPAGWLAKKLCEWLRDHHVPIGAAAIPIPPPEPPVAAGGAGGGENAHGGGEGGSSTRQRWLAKNDSPRLAHVLVELKPEFLARDAKPTSRVQLDSTPRKDSWLRKVAADIFGFLRDFVIVAADGDTTASVLAFLLLALALSIAAASMSVVVSHAPWQGACEF